MRWRVMTWAQRPWTTKCSHSQGHSSPESRTVWLELSPRNETSRAWKLTRSGSAAYRLDFSIQEMRLEFMRSSRSVFARGRRGSSGVEPSIGRRNSLGIQAVYRAQGDTIRADGAEESRHLREQADPVVARRRAPERARRRDRSPFVDLVPQHR